MAPQPRRRPAPATRARGRSGWHSRDTSEGAAGSTTSADPVMALQQSVGNQAVSRLFAQRDPSPGAATVTPPSAPSTGTPATGTAIARTTRSDVDDACLAIYMAINIGGGISSADVEIVLRTLLVQRDRLEQLRRRYDEQYHRTLASDLQHLSPADQLRAQQYMENGSLSAVAKLLLAMDGSGTSEEVLWRVIPDAFHEGNPADRWSALVNSDGAITSNWRGKSLDDAFAEELSGNDLDKARALVRFGQLRPVDKIRIATNQVGTDLGLLFEGLRTADVSTIRNQYRAEYHEDLDTVLFGEEGSWNPLATGELSGNDAERARAYLGSGGSNPTALVDMVRASISGTNDTQLLFSTVEATQARARGGTDAAGAARMQLDHLVSLIPTGSESADPLGLTDVGGLSDGDLARLRAMLGIAESAEAPGGGVGITAAVLNDPQVRRLRALGGVDNSSVFGALLKAGPSEISTLGEAFNDRSSPLHSYLWSNVTFNSGDFGRLDTVFHGTLWQKIRMCAGGAFRDDYEEYAYHLLDQFATPSDLEALRLALRSYDNDHAWPASDAGRALAALDGAFSSTEMTQVRNRIRGGGAGPGADLAGAAADFEADVGREQSWWFGSTDDLNDERRQLATDTIRAGLDGNLSEAEAERLRNDHARGRASLDAYAQLRDEITGYVSQAVQLAAGALVTVVSGGSAGPAVAAVILRAAAVSAAARLLTEKALRGDRFDTVGADGVRAFTAGAVDGVMNCLTAGASSSVLSSIGGDQIRHALELGFASRGLRAANTALEGAIGGSVGGVVDAVTNEDTWRGGTADGLLMVINTAATSAAQGAAMSLATSAATGTYSSLRERLAGEAPIPGVHEATHDTTREGGSEPAPHADDAHATTTDHRAAIIAERQSAPLTDAHPYVRLALEGENGGCLGIIDRFPSWEDAIGHLEGGTGLAAGLPRSTRTELVKQLVAHRDRVAATVIRRGGETLKGASNTPGSDKDFNFTGPDAGRKLLAARTYLDEYHPGWDRRYRMALLIDATRVQTVEGYLAGLSPAQQVRARARVTHEGELLTFARRVRNAEPHERPALLEQLTTADRAHVEEFVGLSDRQRIDRHDQALRDGDELMHRLERTDLSAEQKAAIAEEITLLQMQANALGEEAYINAGGIRGFAQGLELTTGHEQYQSAIDQIDMLVHQLHADHGGLSAMRRYETYKYIYRLCRTLEMAGIRDPNIPMMRDIAYHNYKTNRRASESASDLELTWRYETVRTLVDTHMPTLRAQSLGNTTRGPGGDGPGTGSSRLFSLPALRGETELVRLAPGVRMTTSHESTYGATAPSGPGEGMGARIDQAHSAIAIADDALRAAGDAGRAPDEATRAFHRQLVRLNDLLANAYAGHRAAYDARLAGDEASYASRLELARAAQEEARTAALDVEDALAALRGDRTHHGTSALEGAAQLMEEALIALDRVDELTSGATPAAADPSTEPPRDGTAGR